MKPRHFTTYQLLSLLVLCLSAISSFAQAPPANNATAKVSGRITIEGQPVLGVQVLFIKDDGQNVISGLKPASAKTNADGTYEIENLSAGSYHVAVYAPSYLIEGEMPYGYGKAVNIGKGDQIDDLDFSLGRGGVITGKVTDEYGKPVIAEGVGAFRLDQQGKRDNTAATQMLRWQTDDRGVYRIYGLESGRYIVGVGSASEDALQPIGNRVTFKRTYYPEAVDEKNAKVIEVKRGGEVASVDIKLARGPKSFMASGHVIDAETGKPLAGVMIGCEFAKAAGSSFKMGDATTDSKGEFHLEGLLTNTYIAYVYSPGESDLYSDRINFDVANDDVGGLEIKMVRGASISGVVDVEGTRNPTVLARLSQISLRAESLSQDTAMLMMLLMQGGGIGNINANGTLRIGGVRPGRTRIVAMPPAGMKGFTLARVERNGVEIRELEVAQGEQINGVRLVFTYGTSTLAGRVEIKGGTLPLNAYMTVQAVREGASPEEWWFTKSASVDARGQFTIEGVSEGNYKIYLTTYDPDSSSNFPRIEQSVSMPADMRREITLVLDLKRAGND